MAATLLAFSANPAGAFGGGGSISGTFLAGAPFAPAFCNGSVSVYDANGNQVRNQNGIAYIYVNINYLFTGLSAGEYRVRFQAFCGAELDPLLSYQSTTFYRGMESLEDATPVRVTEGTTRTGINSLQGGGASISGKVTDDSGNPLDGICVDTYDDQGNLGSFGRTNSDGSYVIDQFTAGDYRLRFSDCPDTEPTVIAEFYEDRPSLEEAVPVSLAEAQKVSGIDAKLALVKPEEPGPGPGPGPGVVTPKPAKLRVKVNGPAKVKQGKKATYRVRISNTGGVRANGVKLTVKGKRTLFKAKVGKIPANSARTIKFNLQPKKTGKTKLTFKVSSANAGGKATKRSITVKR